ncbi:MAG: SpaH/EbpB family LPXTG-anchored major pilin [Lachnospiraceae bacterium]|nr:SpaH/EbpB family LPXTG-anchored major pilin [Lachnospiraceae bacterium]
MKRTLKKLAALASAAIMALGVATTALAAGGGTNTITITGSGEAASALIIGNTYELYKLADFDVSTLSGETVYTNITAVAPFTSLQSDIEALNGKNFNDDKAVELAEAAVDLIGSNSPYDTTTTGSFSNVEEGYYLIVETAHGSNDAYISTKYILVAVDGNETVEIKTSKAGVTKKIVSEHDGTLEDADTVAIGDTVTYQLDATIPTYDADATSLTYTLTDTMSAGLTYAGITSVKVSTDNSSWVDATSYTTTGSTGTAGATVTVSLSENDIKNYSYVSVVLTATLNDNAETGATGNPNSVNLTYSNNYYGGGGSYPTPWDTVITYTGELVIKKTDGSSGDVLEGAEFTIYRVATQEEIDDSSVTKETIKINETDTLVIAVKTGVTTGNDGLATAKGLDAGTYYAVETTAPTGYSLDETPVKIELKVTSSAIETATTGEGGSKTVEEASSATSGSAANSAITTNYPATWTSNDGTSAGITNNAGTTLPGTGGIGTTLFTFGGLALVILAAVMFIVYTKKQRKQA